MSKDPGLIAAEEILVGAHEGPAEAWFSVHGFTSALVGRFWQVRGPVGGGPGTRPWAQFWSHSPPSGTVHQRPRAACPRWSGTVMDGGERWCADSKACEGASLP